MAAVRGVGDVDTGELATVDARCPRTMTRHRVATSEGLEREMQLRR